MAEIFLHCQASHLLGSPLLSCVTLSNIGGLHPIPAMTLWNYEVKKEQKKDQILTRLKNKKTHLCGLSYIQMCIQFIA